MENRRETGKLMKSFIGLMAVVVMTVFGFGCCKSQAGPPMTPGQKADLLDTETIAMVHTFNNDTHVMCTGVFVTENVIATANHCIDGLARRLAQEEWVTQQAEERKMPIGMLIMLIQFGAIEVPSGDELVLPDKMTLDVEVVLKENFVFVDKTTLISDDNVTHTSILVLEPSHDLALLKTNGKVGPHGFAPLADEVIVGEAIHSDGHPMGLTWTHADGIVAAWRDKIPNADDDDTLQGPVIQISATLYYGNSGGGVFNDKGELIGICSFLYKVPDAVFLIPMTEVRALMIGQRLIKARI